MLVDRTFIKDIPKSRGIRCPRWQVVFVGQFAPLETSSACPYLQAFYLGGP